MRPVLVLRPEPGACATAKAAQALGHPVVRAPLFRVRPLAPDPALLAGPFDALLLTSANAARLLPAEGAADDWLRRWRALPVYAVGAATAAAARAAGLRCRAAGAGDSAAIVARVAADGHRRLLHLAAREHRAVADASVSITRAVVYAADGVDALPDAAERAARAGAVVLLHSPRAAALFGRLLDAAGLDRGVVGVAALSPAVAAAAGPGWRRVGVAARPTDTALLAVVPALCDEAGEGA